MATEIPTLSGDSREELSLEIRRNGGDLDPSLWTQPTAEQVSFYVQNEPDQGRIDQAAYDLLQFNKLAAKSSPDGKTEELKSGLRAYAQFREKRGEKPFQYLENQKQRALGKRDTELVPFFQKLTSGEDVMDQAFDPDKRSTWNSQFQSGAPGAKTSAANRMIVGHYSGIPQEQLAESWPAYRSRFSKGVFGRDVKDDSEFYSAASSYFSEKKTDQDQTNTLSKKAWSAAIQGKPLQDVLKSADPKFHGAIRNSYAYFLSKTPDRLISLARGLYEQAMADQGEKTEDRQKSGINELTTAYGELTIPERDQVLGMMGFQAQAEGWDVQDYFSRLGAALASGSENVVRSLRAADATINSQTIDRILESGETRFTPADGREGTAKDLITSSSIDTPYETAAPRKITDSERKALEDEKKSLAGISAFNADMANAGIRASRYGKREEDGFWENASIVAAESLPMMGLAVLPYGVGLPLTAQTYFSQERSKLDRSMPNVSKETKDGIAGASAVLMTGLDRLEIGILGGKLPKLGNTLKALESNIANFAARGGARALATVPLRIGTVGAIETSQEVAQDISTETVQQVYAAFSDEVQGPDWNGIYKREKEALGDIVGVSLIFGFISGVGRGAADYIQGPQLQKALTDKTGLRLTGLDSQSVDEIAELAQSKPLDAAEKYQKRIKEIPAAERQKNSRAEFDRIQLDQADVTLAEAGVPTIEKQSDGSAVVKYNDGTTPDRQFTDVAEARDSLVIRDQDEEMGLSKANRELIESLDKSYQKQTGGELKLEGEQGQKKISLKEWAGDSQSRLNQVRNRARIYFRQAEQDMGMSEASDADIDERLGDLFIVGSSSNSFANGVTTIQARIAAGASPRVVLEEASEGVAKYLIQRRGIPIERMQGWIRETEANTSTKLLADDLSALSSENQLQETVEAFSKITVAHAEGRIMDSSLPQAVKNFFRGMKRVIAGILDFSSKVKEFTDSGNIDSEFRQWLDFAAGFDTDGEINSQRARADAEVSADIDTFSIEDWFSRNFDEDSDRYLPSGYFDDYSPSPQKEGLETIFERNGVKYASDDFGVIYAISEGQSVGFVDGGAIQVAPAFQRKGIGSSLLDAYAEKNGKEMRLGSHTPEGRNLFQSRAERGETFSISPDGRTTEAHGDPIIAAVDREAFKRSPEAKQKFYSAAKLKVADVRKRTTELAKTSNEEQGRFDQFRDLALLEAIAKAMPKGTRDVLIREFRKTSELKTQKGRQAYIASLLPKVEEAIETNLRQTLRGEIKKLLKAGMAKVSENRTRSGNIGAEATAIFEEAKKAISLRGDPESEPNGKTASQKAEDKAEVLRSKMENTPDLTDDQLLELNGRIAALELFGDYSNADSSRLTEGLDLLKGVYSEGRAERLAVIKARREQRAERIGIFTRGLGQEGPITDSQRLASTRRSEKFLNRIDELVMEAGLSGSQKIRRIAELSDDPTVIAQAEQMEGAALDAELAEKDMNDSDNLALREAMKSIFGVKYAGSVAAKLRELTRPEVTPATKIEGRKTETVSVPLNQVEAAINGELDLLEAGGVEISPELRSMDDADLAELEQKFDEWDALPESEKSRKRTLKYERTVADGDRQTLGEINQLEGLQLYLTMRQPDQAAKLKRLGYDETTMAQLESWLKPETKALGDWMVSRIGEDSFTLDQLHRSEKGVGLRLVDNYFPVRNDVSGADNGGLDLNGGVQHTGRSIGALKERVKNSAPPAYVNALAVFLANRAQVNFWKSHVGFLREWGGLVKDDRFASVVKVKLGEKYYKSLSDTFKRIEAGGSLNAASLMGIEKIVKKMTSNFAVATLGLRMSTLAINTTAALNAGLEVPLPELVKGVADVIARPQAFKDAWTSPAIQRRLRSGGSVETQLAKSQGLSANAVKAQLDALAQGGVEPINWVDTGAQLPMMAAVWEYTRKKALDAGATEEQSKAEADAKVERVLLRAAQPATRLAKSELELRAAENPFAALFTLFTSEPRKAAAIGYLAAREILTGKGTYGKPMAAQQLATAFVVQVAAAFLIRSAYAALVKPKDNEDEDFSDRLGKRLSDPKAWAYALATEHLKSVPIFGEVYNQAIAGMLDQKAFDSSQNPLNRITQQAATEIGKATGDKKRSTEQQIEGAIDIVQAFGASLPGGQFFAQLANVADFTEGILTSNAPDMLSDEDRIRRIKARMSASAKELSEKVGKTIKSDGKIDKEIQRRKNAAQADRLKAEILPLSPELQQKALKAIDVSDAVIKAAGFKVPKKD